MPIRCKTHFNQSINQSMKGLTGNETRTNLSCVEWILLRNDNWEWHAYWGFLIFSSWLCICTRAKDLCKPEVPHHCVNFENILDNLSRSKYSGDGVTLVLHETSLSCINVAVQVQSSCIYMLTIVIIHVCIINYQNLWPTKVERTEGKQITQKYKTLHTQDDII